MARKHRNIELAVVLKNDPRRLRDRTVYPEKGRGRKDRPRSNVVNDDCDVIIVKSDHQLWKSFDESHARKWIRMMDGKTVRVYPPENIGHDTLVRICDALISSNVTIENIEDFEITSLYEQYNDDCDAKNRE